MQVVVVAHDPAWRKVFAAEARRLWAALGPNAVALHHIGSTAVPGISAKPIIDILMEVASLAELDARTPGMASLGYQAMGAFGLPGRRYFRKDNPAGERTHQVHAYASGDPGLTRHLAFRDYLRTHPRDAAEYSNLKSALARAHPDDIEAYMDGKDSLVKQLERKALAWRDRDPPPSDAGV